MAKKLNEVTKVTTMGNSDYAILNTADGNIVQIKKSDLANALADVMRTATTDKNGLMSSKSILPVGNMKNDDLKNVGSSFGYSYGVEDGSGIAGPFLSIMSESTLQIKAAHDASYLRWRVYSQSKNEWSAWGNIAELMSVQDYKNNQVFYKAAIANDQLYELCDMFTALSRVSLNIILLSGAGSERLNFDAITAANGNFYYIKDNIGKVIRLKIMQKDNKIYIKIPAYCFVIIKSQCCYNTEIAFTASNITGSGLTEL